MSLTDWERNGWVRPHRSGAAEIRDLLAVIDRDLADSGTASLSNDWRMNIAYNAALQAATAALAAAGYRAERDQHHYRVIQSLGETIGADARTIRVLDAFRRKRNVSGYERIGLVSDADVDAIRSLAAKLRDDLVVWLRSAHPELLEGR